MNKIFGIAWLMLLIVSLISLFIYGGVEWYVMTGTSIIVLNMYSIEINRDKKA